MTNNKIVIGIVGEMGAGKGSAAKYLEEKYGAENFRFSTMLRDVLRRIYLPDSRENMQMLSTVLRQSFGEDIMAKVMAEDVAEAAATIIVTEGIRRPSDMVHLEQLPSFHLVAIVTDEKLRFERIHKRRENANDATITWEDFKRELEAEPERKIREIVGQAEFTVNNDGTIEELHQALDEIIKKIRQPSA